MVSKMRKDNFVHDDLLFHAIKFKGGMLEGVPRTKPVSAAQAHERRLPLARRLRQVLDDLRIHHGVELVELKHQLEFISKTIRTCRSTLTLHPIQTNFQQSCGEQWCTPPLLEKT